MVNNPNLEPVNINVYTNNGQILSVCFRDINWKQNSDIYQGL